MSRSACRSVLLAAIVAHGLLFSAPSTAIAQTGTITGRVFNKASAMPLGFANVVLVGTSMGVISMDDGRFTKDRVPPGVYTVRVMMMGFKTATRNNVIVNANETTELDFALEETIAAVTNVIEVLAAKPLIEVTSSDRRQWVSESDFKDMPVDDIVETLGLKTGVTVTSEGMHIRGGRPNEVQHQIDGVIVDDPLGGGRIDVGRLGASGSELISGGMDAEFGNAQSGIIQITTKEGGKVFGGEFRYMTDDFGRADKTYTNYDNVSIGLGGPTPWKPLRYYVSGEATFSDGEISTIEPRAEHKIVSWLKARDRMSHRLNLQSKLSWNQAPFKVTGEAILQRSRFDQYFHNWNISGYAQRVYYFQQLRPANTRAGVYVFGPVSPHYEGPWLEKVNDPAQEPNPRFVIVEQIVRDPQTGNQQTITYTNFRAVDVGGVTILWDERIAGATTTEFRPWVLFEGFQFPQSQFSHTPEDSSYVFFNSSTQTPDVTTQNIHLNLGFNHVVSSGLLYAIKLSRVEFNTLSTVNGKSPAQYASAGLPTEMPDGSYREGGVSQPTWYTDPDHPYFVTAYDYPLYLERKSIRYLLKSDFTATSIKGHRIRTGIQMIYNDLNNDSRAFPAEQRRNPIDGSTQQGRNVNLFHNFNTEGAVYVQDKWQHEGMVVNAGLRLDFFSTGNTNEILINSSEIDKTVDQYKYNWSPRLGFAFPITDRDKFFFHYGRFTQWAGKGYLFAPQDAIGALDPLGNPNLGPELTISYQAGIAHQFTHTIAANFSVFFKDIFGLVSSATVTDDSTGLQSLRWINRTYASSRGLEVSLEKRLSRRFGFETYYTYSFADGVASNANFGRSAEGLTHLPTDEQPLDWDQRHTFNVTLRLMDPNNWGATVIYQYGSGFPWTPEDRFARLQDPTLENSRRFPPTHRLRMMGQKKFNLYGRQLTLFFEGRNLLDQDILRSGGDRPRAFPDMAVAQMDNGAYLTETGRFGGAYMQDIDDDGRNDLIPVNDPSIWEPHRSWRVGLGFEF